MPIFLGAKNKPHFLTDGGPNYTKSWEDIEPSSALQELIYHVCFVSELDRLRSKSW